MGGILHLVDGANAVRIEEGDGAFRFDGRAGAAS
jgi:hypothetical protein